MLEIVAALLSWYIVLCWLSQVVQDTRFTCFYYMKHQIFKMSCCDEVQ